jgi:hypothetical protein
MQVAFVFIALFAAVFGILYTFYNTRHKERLALIDKGADASLFNTGKNESKIIFSWKKFTLKTGMFLMGIATGIIIAALLDRAEVLNPGALYPSMILFFGGLSLVLFYLIDRKIS